MLQCHVTLVPLRRQKIKTENLNHESLHKKLSLSIKKSGIIFLNCIIFQFTLEINTQLYTYIIQYLKL